MSTRKGLLTIAGCFLGLALLIVAVVSLSAGGNTNDAVRASSVATAVPSDVELEPAGDGDGLTEESPEEEAVAPSDAAMSLEEDAAETVVSDAAEPVTEAATAAPAAAQTIQSPTGETWQSGQYAPEPEGPGYLPVFKKAKREDKVISITVDDCFQTENLQQIIQAAEEVGGRITIFPIGKLLQRKPLQEVICAAHENGHEVENHTWSHDGLYNLSDEELANHIFNQDRALDLVLGKNYYSHFLRPMGGDDRDDLRTHTYIKQLGYYGIAHWSASGSSSLDAIKKALSPGTVYLFHCTNKDLGKLKKFIPYAAQQGYRLITLNEMFGYEANYEEPLTDDPKTREVIQLAPYERDYKKIKATTYGYNAMEVQRALKDAGYLTGEPDGIYGEGTAADAARWQSDNGYEANGVLTAEQQKKLLGAA